MSLGASEAGSVRDSSLTHSGTMTALRKLLNCHISSLRLRGQYLERAPLPRINELGHCYAPDLSPGCPGLGRILFGVELSWSF